MKPKDYDNLEKDYDFKRRYFSNTLWWKNLLMFPPICFLFIGLVGIIYLFKSDMLVSWYIIPYVLLFTIGTVWLKVIKKHILKTTMAVEGAFRVCLAAPIGEDNKLIYAIFVNNTHRHNEHYITNLAREISLHDLKKKSNASFSKEAVFIQEEESATEVYVKAYTKKEINKKNAGWTQADGYFPILYINNKNVPVIKRKDMAKK